MAKYKTLYEGFDTEGGPNMTADTVFEDDDAPQDTGLLDHSGQRIYRVKDTVPFGFHGNRHPSKTNKKHPPKRKAKPGKKRK